MFPTLEEAQRRGRAPRQRVLVRGARQGTRHEREGPRPRPGDQGRDHRPARSPTRPSRCKEGAISAPIKGTFGTTLIKVVKIEPDQVKKFEEVAAEIKQTIATDRARSELATRHDKIEDERGGGAAADRDRAEARPHRPHDRGGRPQRARSGGQAGRRLAERRQSGQQRVRHRRRRRQRAAADPRRRLSSGSRSLGVKPARERTARRGPRPGRGALAQRGDFQAAARPRPTEMVEKLKSGAPFADVAAAEGLNVQTTFGLKRGGNPGNTALAARRRGGVPDREGRGRQRRRQQPGRMGRVPGDRHHGAGFRRRVGGGKAHRRRACAARSPRT